ncbi:unnamed protein product [marine sediment metagenome]|uniref:Uncharacterized protein n=1 Tax=marine sediment metagenome TaxID=412755 RepID=X1KDP6_9ZZZZ
MIEFLFVQYSTAEILYLIAVALITATAHSVGGFGGALMMAIVASSVIGVKETVPVVSVAMTVSQSARTWVFRKQINWPIFLRIFLVAFPFMILGVVIYIEMPTNIIAIFLGLFMIIMLPLRHFLARRNISTGLLGLTVICVPYGFLAGTSFGVGLILGPFLLGVGLTGLNLIGTVSALGIVLNGIKSIAFGFSPLLNQELVIIGITLGICTIPGHYLGRWIVANTPFRLHTLYFEAFLFAGGLHFLWQGIYGG